MTPAQREAIGEARLLVRLAPSTATTPAVATWTFGTNNQSSVTGVTYARQDVFTLPDRPQAS